ncbi:hypothetical protein QLS91_09525 [Flavobacterium sp. LB2P84]|nr:hypothetical protein [Flavobacterium yafengii]
MKNDANLSYVSFSGVLDQKLDLLNSDIECSIKSPIHYGVPNYVTSP